MGSRRYFVVSMSKILLLITGSAVLILAQAKKQIAQSDSICPAGMNAISVLGDPLVYCVLGRTCSGTYSPDIIRTQGVGICPATTQCALLPLNSNTVGCISSNLDNILYINPDGTLTKNGQMFPGLTPTSLPPVPSTSGQPNTTSSHIESKSGSSSNANRNSMSDNTDADSSFDPSSKHSGLDDMDINDDVDSESRLLRGFWFILVLVCIGCCIIIAVIAGILLLRRKNNNGLNGEISSYDSDIYHGEYSGVMDPLTPKEQVPYL